MKIASFVIVVSTLFGVAACGGDVAVHDPEHYVPELRYFDIVDSYDTDTARDPRADLALSPYRYNGLFEIFWGVNSLEDYTVSLKINDRPSLVNSITVHSDVCGEHRWCDQAGNLVCEYTENLYMSCDNSNQLIDILPLFEQNPPQTLYLFLEVCDNDSDYCEYDYYPVLME